MTQLQTSYSEPDRIARKLFIFVVVGACAFASLVLVLMRLSNAQLDAESLPVPPIVQLVR